MEHETPTWQNFILGVTLGKGVFGKVILATHQLTNQKVAIKIINREENKNALKVARHETKNLRFLRHPHIIKLHRVISSKHHILMIMEYASGGELFEYIKENKSLSEAEARRIFQQMMSAVDYCHRHKVVHRDLKPQNILLDQSLNVKIADFGFSTIMLDGEFLRSSCGSPAYIAPELKAGKLYAGPEVDIWSCGVILYQLLCGKLPFMIKGVATLQKIPKTLGTSVLDLLRHMLDPDGIQRATMQDIRGNRWFREDLPGYLFPPNPDLGESVVDIEAMGIVCKTYDVAEHELEEALLKGDAEDPLYKTYNDIADKRRKAFKAANSPTDGFYVPMSPITDPSMLHYQCNAPEYIPDPDEPKEPVTMAKMLNQTRTLDQLMADKRKKYTSKKLKFCLGLRSKSQPADIIHSLCSAMKALDYEWMVVTNYHLRVRKRSRSAENHARVSVQLYQVDPECYVLDFRSHGHPVHAEDDLAKEMTRVNVTSADQGVPSSSSPPSGRRKHSFSPVASPSSALSEIKSESGNADDMDEKNADDMHEKNADDKNEKDDDMDEKNADDKNEKNDDDMDEKNDDDTEENGPAAVDQHKVMEFFEMCANLIASLTRETSMRTDMQPQTTPLQRHTTKAETY